MSLLTSQNKILLQMGNSKRNFKETKELHIEQSKIKLTLILRVGLTK